MSAPPLFPQPFETLAPHSSTSSPLWVRLWQRWCHILSRNPLELTQITAIWGVGLWWLLPGESWQLPLYADLRFHDLGEDFAAVLLLTIAHLHYVALWRRRYRARQALSFISALFWFVLAAVAWDAAPHAIEVPIGVVMGVAAATTFWSLGGKT